jgi:hypothetical protein
VDFGENAFEATVIPSGRFGTFFDTFLVSILVGHLQSQPMGSRLVMGALPVSVRA